MERALERARFTGREIDAIMWDNWRRVMTEVLG
jgi:microsomal dipeptidase-like Zn-dependent dipeptidase